MSAPEATAVIAPSPAVQPAPVTAPPAPPAPAAVTVEHISALHRHLDELASWIGQRFKEVVALVEKAAPVVETAAAAVAPMLGAAGAPIVAAVDKVAGVVACCAHAIEGHGPKGCTAPGCSCSKTN